MIDRCPKSISGTCLLLVEGFWPGCDSYDLCELESDKDKERMMEHEIEGTSLHLKCKCGWESRRVVEIAAAWDAIKHLEGELAKFKEAPRNSWDSSYELFRIPPGSEVFYKEP